MTGLMAEALIQKSRKFDEYACTMDAKFTAGQWLVGLYVDEETGFCGYMGYHKHLKIHEIELFGSVGLRVSGSHDGFMVLVILGLISPGECYV